MIESGEKQLVGPSAHDIMAKRLNEAKKAMKISIEKERLRNIARHKQERIDKGTDCYREAAKYLAEKYFYIETYGFKQEEYAALDGFVKKEVFKKLTFHGLWNTLSGFGLFFLARHLAGFSNSLSRFYFLCVLAGALFQFLVNVKVYWVDFEDSELRFLKFHFSFLWNRKYFLADAEERQQKELAAQAAQQNNPAP